MTKWAMLRSFDKFERDLNGDACVVVSAKPDLADGAARAAAGCHISTERDVERAGRRRPATAGIGFLRESPVGQRRRLDRS
jgi:hypothetical protein